MNLFKTFKTSEQLEKNGIWIDYGANEHGNPIRFRVAREGGSNSRYNKRWEELLKPHRAKIRHGQLEESLGRQLLIQAFCETCLLEWEGVTDEQGQLITFSVENAKKLFKDLPDLFLDLREQATKASLFREEQLEADLGNSGTSSATA